jgi:hypothetical protein
MEASTAVLARTNGDFARPAVEAVAWAGKIDEEVV